SYSHCRPPPPRPPRFPYTTLFRSGVPLRDRHTVAPWDPDGLTVGRRRTLPHCRGTATASQAASSESCTPACVSGHSLPATRSTRSEERRVGEEGGYPRRITRYK